MEKVRYLVREKGRSGALYVGKDIKDCLMFVTEELWQRNERDGYDEKWHNANIVIVKEILKEEIVIDI